MDLALCRDNEVCVADADDENVFSVRWDHHSVLIETRTGLITAEPGGTVRYGSEIPLEWERFCLI